MHSKPPFSSFFIGGFECSSHRRWDGTRLDLLDSTRHAELAQCDYGALHQCGISSVRDGVRWHLVETAPGKYDWSSFLPMLHAADSTRTTVAWDVCHYGWPDFVDIWSEDFVERISCFGAALAEVVRDESDLTPIYCPVNEISYWAWSGAEVGRIGPFATGQGPALKRQLVRAALAATRAIRGVDHRARFLYAEPSIHVVPASNEPQHIRDAENYRLAQFEALDMIAGRTSPELGGSTEALDIIGVNFYPDNQWYLGGSTIPLGHHAYRPFRDMLLEWFERYDRPVVVSETGAEGSAQPSWLHYICGEVRAAMSQGIPVQGVCIYPITEYRGWDNDRPCEVGLLSAPDVRGNRLMHSELLAELQNQNQLFTPTQMPQDPLLRTA